MWYYYTTPHADDQNKEIDIIFHILNSELKKGLLYELL
jgi:hypothetical protein